MKALITLAIVFVLYFLGKSIYDEYQAKTKRERDAEVQAATGVGADGLPALPPQLESALQQAQAQGAPGLRRWLDTYGRSVQDPRLASIQLDYAVALARQNPGEAKRIFQAVKARTPRTSPVHPRIAKLEATFGN